MIWTCQHKKRLYNTSIIEADIDNIWQKRRWVSKRAVQSIITKPKQTYTYATHTQTTLSSLELFTQLPILRDDHQQEHHGQDKSWIKQRVLNPQWLLGCLYEYSPYSCTHNWDICQKYSCGIEFTYLKMCSCRFLY